KNNVDLLGKVNRTITAMKQDGRYDNLISKHFGEAALESMKKQRTGE
ncbi:hypothetical protein HG445_003435, partial [Candidatus Saccharibacteria bacterium]|nr:hypothetical protein [Candidatus Saccharibacteria bacterium]